MTRRARTTLRAPRIKSARSTWDWMVREPEKDGLTRDRIVAAAVALADEAGLEAVSIRTVAERLGCSPMALYHYIPTKRDLLHLMLDAAHGEFRWQPEELSNWRDALIEVAWAIRRRLKRHPWVVAIRAMDPEHGPQYMRALESVLATLERLGVDVGLAAQILAALYAFVSGFRASEQVHVLPLMSEPALDAGDYPRIRKVITSKPELTGDDRFNQGLQWFLDGLQADGRLPSLGPPGRLSGIRLSKNRNTDENSP